MTPKQKAEELWMTFYEILPDIYSTYAAKQEAKKYAWIVAHEMICNAGYIWGGIIGTEIGLSARDEFRKYWKQVKIEIEKINAGTGETEQQ